MQKNSGSVADKLFETRGECEIVVKRITIIGFGVDDGDVDGAG